MDFLSDTVEKIIYLNTLNQLGRFDNGLYWVTYKDNDPNKRVQEFLKNPHNNAYIIKGYDADSFMVKLNNELGLPQPEIVDKPFTALKIVLEGIVDINDQEYFKGVKKRLDIAKRQVDHAINQFDKEHSRHLKIKLMH
jgi:type II secretory pathway component PulC